MSQQPNRIGYFPQQPSQQSPKPPKKPSALPIFFKKIRKKLLQKNTLRTIAFVACICVFCTCLFLLVRYAFNILISRNASKQLENIYTVANQQTASPSALPTATAAKEPPAATAAPVVQRSTNPEPTPGTAIEWWPAIYPDNPTLRISSIFYQLQAQNKDIIAWLKIDGLLEEAVVQRDNEYYLTHNALQQKSVTGALFLDENCHLETVPTQMVIHGHNMKEGAMFGSLKKYKVKDASYYRAHPFIDFNTIYENGRYVIFSVAEVDIRSNKPDYLPFWQSTRFASSESFMDYVERAKLLSHYRCNVDVQPGDRLLTLSTCTGTDENKRLIIMARKLRNNESEFELNMSILSTTDR